MIRPCLTANQLKWVALLLMTIDHAIPLMTKISAPHFLITLFTIMGRAAAPLFVFILSESLRNTQSKAKLILRLYIACIATGIYTMLMNAFFGETLLMSAENNLSTLFYIALFVAIAEKTLESIRSNNSIFAILLVGSILLIQWFFSYLHVSLITQLGIKSFTAKVLITDLLACIAPSVLYTEYSLLFVLMGVLFYFVHSHWKRGTVFFTFCVVAYLGSYLISEKNMDLWPCNTFFAQGQHWMIVALPLMLLYNGRRGTEHKAFFYVYYPVHRHLLSLIAKLL